MAHLIELKGKISNNPRKRLRRPVDFTLDKGEQLAVTGSNGAGKSIFTDMLSGQEDIRRIAFRDAFSLTGASFYYQQRWNSQDAESVPAVRDILDKKLYMYPERNGLVRERLFSLLQIGPMLDKRTVMLSSGELRKLQLAYILASSPKILIIDNPYIGLDSQARQTMNDVLSALSEDGHIQVILNLCKNRDIPSFITDVLPMENMEAGEKLPYGAFIDSGAYRGTVIDNVLDESERNAILDLPYRGNDYNAETVARLNNVSIRYGTRTILDSLDWEVHNGDKWALCGKNGSGKSTLLSLICADNPQSYACDITLFDKKRGSGESIWEIKSHIGYVSSEMYRAFLLPVPAWKIVASGFSDTGGIRHSLTQEQTGNTAFWMGVFGISGLKDRCFTELSSGEQHLCLLARAFVKDPELLVLDEPMHCLDERNCKLAKDIITTFCQRRNKTLIMVSHCEEDFAGLECQRLTLP